MIGGALSTWLMTVLVNYLQCNVNDYISRTWRLPPNPPERLWSMQQHEQTSQVSPLPALAFDLQTSQVAGPVPTGYKRRGGEEMEEARKVYIITDLATAGPGPTLG